MKLKFLLLLVAIFIIIVYTFYYLKPDFYSKAYNRKEWNNNPSVRAQMANTLI